jgi:hypothetical protein
LPTPFTRKRRYCLTGALDDAAGAAGVLLTAFLFTTAVALAGFAAVVLVDFLAAFFFEVGAVLLVVPAGAPEGGVLCANIPAAVKAEIRIMRFIFVSPCGVLFLFPLQIHLAAIRFLEH